MKVIYFVCEGCEKSSVLVTKENEIFSTPKCEVCRKNMKPKEVKDATNLIRIY